MKLRTIASSVRALPKAAMRTAPTVNSWRDGRTTAERGYGGRWQRAREAFLRRNPLCVFCDREGRIELATVVDHVIPHQGDQALFWKRSNWQPLCKVCHDTTKKRMEAGKTQPARIGVDGWPME